MPVPNDADDDYFAPLASLRLGPETELYLGVLHLEDGVEGARRRIATAKRHVDAFGASSDCGWGRGGTAEVTDLLELHRAMSRSLPLDPELAGTDFAWPEGFVRVPDEEWTKAEVHESGKAYDNVDDHGWYSNLNRLVDSLAAHLRGGDLLMDYSGGTGILLDRLRLRIFDRQVGALIVDAGAKFLRVAHHKYHDDPLVAMRLLRFIREEKRLQSLDEVLGPEIYERGVDTIAVANAIHLYPNLAEVADAWHAVLRPGGKVFVCSGNLRNPRAAPGEWILDETVWVINDIAEGLVRADPKYAKYRPVLDDTARMAAHAKTRDRVFLKPRTLEEYTTTLDAAGLKVTDVGEETIVADVAEWFEFLAAYHDAVLGWVGGTKKLDGADPTPAAVEDRLAIMRQAMDVIFGGRRTFNACWTYITCTKA